MRYIIISLITLYQKTLSPDHSWLKAKYPYGFCHFYPTCSEYAKESVLEYGTIKGSYKGLLRVLRCNPWTKPSIDLVNLNKKAE
ncbi:MAG: membrane protein insertion efficiency factor YidD [Candidatus Doudnabacteria bacterium]|nr:membrane protein insertion efficiency factor YidD [Candidatus Doudnabacteria bacterium]